MSFTRVITVVTAVLSTIVLSAGAAVASTPTTWEKPEPATTLELLAKFGGGTVGVIVAVVILAMILNSVSRHYSPHTAGTEIDTKQD